MTDDSMKELAKLTAKLFLETAEGSIFDFCARVQAAVDTHESDERVGINAASLLAVVQVLPVLFDSFEGEQRDELWKRFTILAAEHIKENAKDTIAHAHGFREAWAKEKEKLKQEQEKERKWGT